MDKLIKSILDTCAFLQPLSVPLLITAIFVSGILLLIPIKKFHAIVLDILPAAAIGFALMMFAVQIGNGFASNFK